MLSELTSEEIAEWIAYFKVKAQKEKEFKDRSEAEEKAKALAKASNG